MLEKLIVFVEEPSMEAALESLLPKMLTDTPFEIRRFQCKDDMLKQLPARLRGFSAWMPERWLILVLVDRDDDDCRVLKRRLDRAASDAGLRTKTATPATQRFQVANRIAIEELEAWFFGDWAAVRAASIRGYRPRCRKKLDFATRTPSVAAPGRRWSGS